MQWHPPRANVAPTNQKSEVTHDPEQRTAEFGRLSQVELSGVQREPHLEKKGASAPWANLAEQPMLGAVCSYCEARQCWREAHNAYD